MFKKLQNKILIRTIIIYKKCKFVKDLRPQNEYTDFTIMSHARPGGGSQHHLPDVGRTRVLPDRRRGARQCNDEWPGRGGHGHDTDGQEAAHDHHSAEGGRQTTHRMGTFVVIMRRLSLFYCRLNYHLYLF